jgi:hypothetical protein
MWLILNFDLIKVRPIGNLSIKFDDDETLSIDWKNESKCLRLLTIHLSFLRENNFSSTAWWINGESLLEALLNVGTPDTLGIGR